MSLPVVPVCLLDFLKVWGYRDTFNGNMDRKNMTFNAKKLLAFSKISYLKLPSDCNRKGRRSIQVNSPGPM